MSQDHTDVLTLKAVSAADPLPPTGGKADARAPGRDTAATPQAADGKPQKSFGEKLFNGLNYWGIGWIANQALSLYITYNAMTAKPVQRGIERMKTGMEKMATSGARTLGANNQFVKHAGDKARSAVEIGCMFVAGCIILAPMKLLEDRKEPIVNWINRKWYNGEAPKTETHPHTIAACEGNYAQDPMEKQTWGNLFKARVIAMGAILGVDQLIEAFNNSRAQKGQPNFDTVEWEIGGKAYDGMGHKTRERFINFFDRHGATAEGIQPMVRERLQKVVGPDVKKMVFAEQARFFLKEFVLCWGLASILYLASEAGIRKKKACAAQDGQDHNAPLTLTPPAPCGDDAQAAPAASDNAAAKGSWQSRVPAPVAQFQEALTHLPEGPNAELAL